MANRLNVDFPSDGQLCRAWLYLPEGAEKRPVVVMGHGLGAIREMRLDAFAERFCSAGYAALVFDYRHFGASEGQPRQLLDIKRQLSDWKAALRFVRNRADVDADRVILWGSSFGGGHVLATAADDKNVLAVISQCPFTDGLASVMALEFGTALRVTVRSLLDKAGSWIGRPPFMLPTAGNPGTTALMTAPDAGPGYLALVPEGARFRNEVAARVALDILRYFPGKRTPEIRCPVLFCVCEPDSVAPSKATLRRARKAPLGEIKVYPDGHFDIYVGAAFERVVADQIGFLKRRAPCA